ncbi:hypothetical protein [Natronolimnobius baerhuensis]|uniref:Gins51 C-terminal domain-containing protein n=1 Tax=Natronolimnobius baerhuensis TaxID=253108 RepID=A0A202E7F9_9EURY|nr:hypothetical protein [Natronolimnobius baerhuensis]OVE84154.1 hypothetical protein B2G88_06945 [Natronolimnobius baerhuensis]
MNLDELRSVQSKERQKDSLQNLRPSFYQEVGQYISDLEDERDQAAERATNPFSSPEVSHLTDEIETAKDVVEAIYERRMGKLVKQASLAAAGMAADDEGLTAEEADLFDDLVERIESNKTRVLDVLEGVEPAVADPELDDDVPPASQSDTVPDSGLENAPARTPGDGDAPPVPPREQESSDGETPEPPVDTPSEESSSGVSPADVMGGDSGTSPGAETDTDAGEPAPPTPPTDESAPEPSPPASEEPRTTDSSGESTSESALERVTVRITQDIGPILGIDDREYTLSSDDIVTLPEQNATPLLEQDAAESLEEN